MGSKGSTRDDLAERREVCGPSRAIVAAQSAEISLLNRRVQEQS